jgi:hypothetical protein
MGFILLIVLLVAVEDTHRLVYRGVNMMMRMRRMEMMMRDDVKRIVMIIIIMMMTMVASLHCTITWDALLVFLVFLRSGGR